MTFVSSGCPAGAVHFRTDVQKSARGRVRSFPWWTHMWISVGKGKIHVGNTVSPGYVLWIGVFISLPSSSEIPNPLKLDGWQEPRSCAVRIASIYRKILQKHKGLGWKGPLRSYNSNVPVMDRDTYYQKQLEQLPGLYSQWTKTKWIAGLENNLYQSLWFHGKIITKQTNLISIFEGKLRDW